MRVKCFGRWLAYDTEDIKYSDIMTLGKPGEYIHRCRAELTREYFGDMYEKQRKVSIATNYCFGKTLAELEQNCQKAIKKAWEDYHRSCTVRTYADAMWM